MNFISRVLSHYRSVQARIKGFPPKKVLVLEGGGMRGVFLVGVLQAFMDRGYLPWRAIIGTSAGALIGAAYGARQIHLARDGFFSELLSGRFIRMTNIFRPEKHILNLDWMVDRFIEQEGSLNLRRLRTTACPVIIVTTGFYQHAPLQPMYLNTHYDDIPRALKASAAIPFLYRNFVPYKEDMLIDGSVCDPLPYKKALEMGFSERDILVVTTRPRGYRKVGESFWVKRLYESYYKEDQYQYLLAALEEHYSRYNRLLDELEQDHDEIDVIYPPADFRVNRLTRGEDKILEGFEQGVNAARSHLYHLRAPEPVPKP
ncbi:MAG: patatin family protein [Desulfobacterales bacterium]|nr:patatin family protein [Desulfobacterales bacterium]